MDATEVRFYLERIPFSVVVGAEIRKGTCCKALKAAVGKVLYFVTLTDFDKSPGDDGVVRLNVPSEKVIYNGSDIDEAVRIYNGLD